MTFKHVSSWIVAAALLVPAIANGAQTRVFFLSNPPGAQVVDANLGELGSTPFRMNIKRGTELECTFSKAGFETRTVTVTVTGLKADVRADLPALPLTTVRLGVEPRETTVRLLAPDGSELYSGEGGRVHTLPNELWGDEVLATFRVEAWAPGYRPLDQSVELQKHGHHDLSLPLSAFSTVLSLTADPEQARVYDQFLGYLGWTPLETRITLADLLRARSRRGVTQGEAGHLLLTIARDGYNTQSVQVPLDFERAENAVSVSLLSVAGEDEGVEAEEAEGEEASPDADEAEPEGDGGGDADEVESEGDGGDDADEVEPEGDGGGDADEVEPEGDGGGDADEVESEESETDG